MDLSVYLIAATVVTFMLGAAIACALAFATGQFNDLDAAARVVLDGDEPMPTRWDGDR
jgi:nitrogen fixation-related uncharacterized protein